MDTFTTMPPPELATLHDDRPAGPGLGRRRLLDSCPDAALDALVACAGAETGTGLLFGGDPRTSGARPAGPTRREAC